MWYIIAGIMAVSVIVTVHEFGHFASAKLFKIPVETFCLGYGKPFIKKLFKGTVYGIGPVPFGGYVKIPGLDPREIALLSDEEKEGFVLEPYWKRVFVVAGGPVANVLLAIVIYVAVFMIGVPGVTMTIEKVEKGSPADKAGVKAGDTINAVNGNAVKIWDDFVANVQNAKETKVELTVIRNKRTVTLEAVPGKKDGRKYIGVMAGRTEYNIGMGFLTAVKASLVWTVTLIYEIFRSLVLLLLGRLPFRPVSPIGIVQVSSQAAQHGLTIFLNFVAFVSVAIGATNLVPIFPLDGARIVLWSLERAIKRQLSEKAVLAYQYSGVGFLLIITAWALYLDVFRAMPDPFK